MQAGLLREIIRFQESRTQRDELGGSSDNWVDVFSKRADVRQRPKPLSPRWKYVKRE